ncbi:hypothetical protein O6P43_027629 [Quillaja saponaria]|uniref:Uncharacterized protein n=1 Tax=Quillaja saponaria TaxID=32244 RepID=A0AAD7L555_QUISA|nr:hypothetical protein O6P43_027629 [Quillaja saponaria]
MSYYPEQTQLDNNFVVYNGEEFGEDFVGERQQEEEFYSGHDFDPNYKGDSSGIEIRPTLNSRDFCSGKLFVGGVSWETTEDRETLLGFPTGSYAGCWIITLTACCI